MKIFKTVVQYQIEQNVTNGLGYQSILQSRIRTEDTDIDLQFKLLDLNARLVQDAVISRAMKQSPKPRLKLIPSGLQSRLRVTELLYHASKI